MGSGGMIVMDETSSMVEVARYFMEFCRPSRAASAFPAAWAPFRCTTCCSASLDGEASPVTPASSSTLRDLLREASLCGLGQSAPNPCVEHAASSSGHEYDDHCSAHPSPEEA